MKESNYNFYVNEGKIVLLYNAFTQAYLMLSEKSFAIFQSHLKSLNELESVNYKFYNTLVENGFIIPNDFDELNQYLNFRLKRKFTTNLYELIVNPTMDCNLNCWYCYETHETGSKMTDDMINSLINHIKNRYKQERFESFSLSFFGGEPLLRNNAIETIISETKTFTDQNNISLHVSFTTNATLVKKSMLELLKNVKTTFQITIDGNEQVHNSIRHFKNSKKSTYSLILEKVKLIQDNLKECNIAIRINYNQDTLKLLKNTIDDLDFADREKVRISMHRIWQVNPGEIVWKDILNFTEYAKSKGFEVSFMDFEQSGVGCYANNYSQAIINYDGRVFKCTARDFKNIEADGILNPSGEIVWNEQKLSNRLHAELPKMCLECKFLPSCAGLCSQKNIEGVSDNQCMMNSKISIEDYIVYNFNKYGSKLIAQDTITK
ncbi:MAG: radical SAM protein [Bacteroidales bacterium]|nr:radical SAM protein [Bacteroidales bacterium]MDY0198420.1 radical SAM protein [Tenuifilaceae bacterium]